MNAAQSVTATFMVSGIDLIETAVTNPPSSIGHKGSFSVTDTTMNQGAVAAGASTTRYYLSVDTQKSSDDILLNGSRAVPGLASGATSTGTVTVTVPANVQSGTFFLVACSDDLSVVLESNEGNNCTASASQVTVTH
jgi:subtilase family serine protease